MHSAAATPNAKNKSGEKYRSATDQFRNGFFRTLFGDLLGRVHLRAFRHVLDKHVLDFRKIVMLQRADWHNIGEVGEFVDFNELVDQPVTA